MAAADTKLTASHRLGACIATSGPGASNLVTGLLDWEPNNRLGGGTADGIAALKADIEGWEFAVLDQVLGSAATSLPRQIAIELHLRTHPWRNVSGFDGAGLGRVDIGAGCCVEGERSVLAFA